MPVHISDPEKLSAWLVNEIRPLTDADPQVLSKYIIAILRKDKQDHKTFCEEQLEVFLGSKSRAFVDRLFSVVQKDGYLGASSGVSRKAPPRFEPKGGETIKKEAKPLAAVDESLVAVMLMGILVLAVVLHLEPVLVNDRNLQFVRHCTNTSSVPPQPAQVVRCRDFEEKGYCTLGDLCRFDHGPDPLVVENPIRRTGHGLLSGYGYVSGGSKAYDVNGNGPAIGAYDPEAPGLNAQRPNERKTMVARVKGPEFEFDEQSEVHHQWGNNRNYRRIYRRADTSNNKCSLVIRRIPEELNVLSKLNEYFSRFGNITNVQVKYQGHPETACIAFATHEEAKAAFMSSDAVLNNRFIRVYWDREGSDAYRPHHCVMAYPQYYYMPQPFATIPTKNYSYKSKHYLENEKRNGSQGTTVEERSLIALYRSENVKYSQAISDQWRLLASIKIESDPNKRSTMKASFEKSDEEVRKMQERIVELSDKVKEVQRRTALKRGAQMKLDDDDMDRSAKEPKMEVDDDYGESAAIC
ncbi:hypothetical protein QR680_013723 [Steinernema hermaphroditum]|uniref:RNA-binding protein 26 n=1 Tax=Steinernema hermaphroditum TaxID=289476 RepID=A0AA39M2U5_9BILA|nr:hypothetical protein QR680_013723 [Steinernema hermaphroditum]